MTLEITKVSWVKPAQSLQEKGKDSQQGSQQQQTQPLAHHVREYQHGPRPPSECPARTWAATGPEMVQGWRIRNRLSAGGKEDGFIVNCPAASYRQLAIYLSVCQVSPLSFAQAQSKERDSARTTHYTHFISTSWKSSAYRCLTLVKTVNKATNSVSQANTFFFRWEEIKIFRGYSSFS